jgi:uncharacterized membrane protein
MEHPEDEQYQDDEQSAAAGSDLLAEDDAWSDDDDGWGQDSTANEVQVYSDAAITLAVNIFSERIKQYVCNENSANAARRVSYSKLQLLTTRSTAICHVVCLACHSSSCAVITALLAALVSHYDLSYML